MLLLATMWGLKSCIWSRRGGPRRPDVDEGTAGTTRRSRSPPTAAAAPAAASPLHNGSTSTDAAPATGPAAPSAHRVSGSEGRPPSRAASDTGGGGGGTSTGDPQPPQQQQPQQLSQQFQAQHQLHSHYQQLLLQFQQQHQIKIGIPDAVLAGVTPAPPGAPHELQLTVAPAIERPVPVAVIDPALRLLALKSDTLPRMQAAFDNAVRIHLMVRP